MKTIFVQGRIHSARMVFVGTLAVLGVIAGLIAIFGTIAALVVCVVIGIALGSKQEDISR